MGATESVQPGTVTPSQRNRTVLQPEEIHPRVIGVGGIEPVHPDSVLPSLNTPRVLQSEGARTRRVLELNQNGSPDEVISRFSARDLSTDGQAESGAGLRRQNQDSLEEKINNLIRGMSKFSTTMQGAEAMYQDLQERVRVLEASNSKVWDRLDADDQRFKRLDVKLDDKMEMVQEWFVHMSAQVSTEVPAEIVNSIHEVIADSSPGIAVNRMSAELDEIRGSLDSSRHIMEGLRGLVVDLSYQVVNNSIQHTMYEPRVQEKDSQSPESHAREREI